MEITRTSLRKKRSNDYGSAPQQTRYGGDEKGGYGRELRESLSSLGQGGRRETPVIKAAAIEAADPTKNTQYIDTEAVRTAMEKLKNLAVQAGFAKDPTDATVKPTTTSGGGGGKGFFSKDDLSGMSTQQLVDRDNQMYGNTFPDGAIGIGSKSTDDFTDRYRSTAGDFDKSLGKKQADKTYEKNRLKEGEKFADRGQREAVNASGFQQKNVRGSGIPGKSGKDESARPRQTVAALPSDYKKTEAKAFLDAKAYKALKDSGLDKTVGGQSAQVNVGPGNMGTFGLGTAGKGAPSGDALKAGSIGISQKGRDQAAINKGVAAAKKTGIPTNTAAQGGAMSQAARDQAAIQRGVVAAKATGIPSGANLKEGSFNITRKPAPKPAYKPRKQAAEASRASQAAEAKRKAEAAVDKKSAEGAKATGIPTKPVAGSFGISAKGKAEAEANKAEVRRKEAVAKAKSYKPRKQAAEASRASQAAAKAKSEGKTKAQQAAAARKAAGPNRAMGFGQKTRAQAGPQARTAAGNRARVKANARKRAQAAAKKRKAAKKKSAPKKKTTKKTTRKRTTRRTSRRRRGRRGRRRCDIRCKVNISLLMNMNLLRDDLAELAYFVKDLQK